MTTKEVIQNADERMAKAVEAAKREMATLRTGRANPSMLDRVMVTYYGMETPLQQLATINVPEARTLIITPFDKSSIGEIEKGIQKADLGLSPSNDGDVIRIAVPALTDERRKEMTKLLKKYAEDGRVAVRNVRRDANDEIKKQEKNSEVTEDDSKRSQDEIQKLTDKHIAVIDEAAENKEQEIMEV
ncbi:ribosome recycling factor [Salsuginibacillus halophilus]|uniref:Ribosome-recycling factor n=1 Tax=Salsuginibacillus halophilus TaxID=517424 RepID=A0A2P8HYC4_9BACI|nr:ribosome recycling factor [Salsuginibacillus halophilus]PSL51220.1 ribosome recycling factor [Salsuginibacillus halophilus]